MLKQQITQGWPRQIKKVDSSIRPYWSFREDLTVEDDILLKGTRLIVPYSMRDEMIQKTHEGHLGIEKCVHRMMNAFYFPGCNKRLKDLIVNCTTCIKYSQAKPKPKPAEQLGQEIPDSTLDQVSE